MTREKFHFLRRILKKVLYKALFGILPRSYRQEAIELIEKDSRTDTIVVFFDYFIGAINYRYRKLWIPVAARAHLLFRSIVMDETKREDRIPFIAAKGE
jgi:hypothetical protein